MTTYDLVVRSRRAVLPDGTRPAAVAISGPAIAAVADYDAELAADRDIDLGGLSLSAGGFTLVPAPTAFAAGVQQAFSFRILGADGKQLAHNDDLPGTTDAYPNWRIPLPLSVEELLRDPRVLETVQVLRNR